MIFVVLGMHKSGTTLLARILHHSGISMGDFEGNVGYDKGEFYERIETLLINVILLGWRVHHIPMKTEINKKINHRYISWIQAVIERLSREHEKWGFKDPRTCLTYPFWKGILAGNHRLIVIVRHPNEIVSHFARKRNPLKVVRDSWIGVNAWYRYNQAILSLLREAETSTYIVLEYERFMTDDSEMQRLQEFVGISLQDMRDPSLYRSKKNIPLLMRLVIRFYEVVHHSNILDLYHSITRFRIGTG